MSVNLLDKFGYLPFTPGEALEAGLAKRQWQAILDSKTLLKQRRGVYLALKSPDSRIAHAQLVAGALKNRDKYMACSGSAVALLDLPNPYGSSFRDVPATIAGPRSAPKLGMRLNPGWEPIQTNWGACTNLIDTATVIASELALPEALIVTDAVARRLAGTTNRHVLASERCRTEVRRRLTHRCDLPALKWANPAVESAAESFYRGHMILSGFTDPACGVPMLGTSGKQYFIDILLPDLAIEIDGELKYNDVAALVAEKTREDDLRATGLGFHREWAKATFGDPATAMLRLLEYIAQRYPQAYPHLGITTAV